MTINNITCTDSHWRDVLIMGLSVNKSVTSLTVTVSDYEYLSCKEWVHSLESCLEKSKSLTTLTLTVNDYSKCKQHDSWVNRLRFDNFSEKTSLTEPGGGHLGIF